MKSPAFRVVIDTNTVLRGIVGGTSAAARLLRMVDRRAVIVRLSKPLADEYRFVLGLPEVVAKYPGINDELVERTIARMRYLGEYSPAIRSKFPFPRDPQDAMLVELAIDGEANYIVTADRDLLALPSGHTGAASRFRQRLPAARIVEAGEFLRLHGDALAG